MERLAARFQYAIVYLLFVLAGINYYLGGLKDPIQEFTGKLAEDICSNDFVFTSSRVIVIADVHADIDNLIKALRMADLIGEYSTNWIGGNSVLVQTGDIMDRGPDSLGVFHLFKLLSEQARDAGGCVLQLLGNHELMNLVGDFRYAEDLETAAFGGLEKRRDSVGPSAPLGKHLRSLPIVASVTQRLSSGTNFTTVFAHAGVDPRLAARMSIAQMNSLVRNAFHGASESEIRHLYGTWPILLDKGPLWTRVYAYPDNHMVCSMLNAALNALNGDRMIIGHTIQIAGKPTIRCHGRLVLADTGMSSSYQGGISLVQLEPIAECPITLFS